MLLHSIKIVLRDANADFSSSASHTHGASCHPQWVVTASLAYYILQVPLSDNAPLDEDELMLVVQEHCEKVGLSAISRDGQAVF